MPEISITALAISLAPILGVAWISHRWSEGGRETMLASLRMVVQLIAVGFVLIFLFASGDPLIGLAVVVVMIVVSSLISIRTVKTARLDALWKAGLGIGVAGGLTLALVLFGVLRLSDPWYQPRIIIPIAGMIFSNAMTAVTLAAERMARERAAGLAPRQVRAAAWSAAMIPQINALYAVGLVSLPGMMTGQILSGVDPLIAVRYQIVVMAMILESAGFATAIFLWLSERSGGGGAE